jgi:hypothetical protein
MKVHIPIFSKNEIITVSCAALWLGILYNYLCYWITIGISFSLFILISVLTYNIVLKKLWNKITKPMILLSISAVLFSSLLTIRVSSWLNFFNTVATFYSLFLLIALTIEWNIERYKALDFWPRLARFIPGFLNSFGYWLKDASHLDIIPKTDGNRNSHIFKGILITIPIIFILTSLLASADLVFSKYLEKFFSFNVSLDYIWRPLQILLVSSIFFGGYLFVIRYLKSPKKESSEEPFIPKSDLHIEANIILGAICVLFSIFVVFQITYLFWGQNLIIQEGFTYAYYAKRWFFELAVVGCIIFLILWIFDGLLYGHKKTSPSALFKGFSTLLIILTLCILASALFRLGLYVDAYWFTELRFYGYMFLIVVTCEFILILTRLYRQFSEWIFITVSLYILWVVIIFCNIINPESYISSRNLAQDYSSSSFSMREVDVWYISTLSEDAVDNLISAFSPFSQDKSLRNQICAMRVRLNSYSWDWRDFHYSRYHAFRALTKRFNISISNSIDFEACQKIIN